MILVHRIPFPPNKGDKIRSFNLLKQVAQDHQVWLGAFVDDPDDWAYADELDKYCVETKLIQLNSRCATLGSVVGLLQNKALTLPYYKKGEMQRWVDEVRERHAIEKVIVYSSSMAQYVEGAEWSSVQRLVDFVDVDSDKWRQYAGSKNWPMSMLYRRESVKLLEYETAIARLFDKSFFVSEKEADLFRQLAPGLDNKISHYDNGVDTDFFSPEREYDNPYEAGRLPVVFTGAMDYWANVDAVVWFAEEALARVRAAHPEVEFVIVGSRPGKAVQQLAAIDGITVTGSVEDVRPYIAHARVSVAPMRIARGVQNKVLEAMAMAKPVVVTTQGFDGIRAEPGSEVYLADEADAFGDRVIELLANEQQSVAAARERVVHDYSWAANLERICSELA